MASTAWRRAYLFTLRHSILPNSVTPDNLECHTRHVEVSPGMGYWRADCRSADGRIAFKARHELPDPEGNDFCIVAGDRMRML